jgi:serine acetyltransferase
MIKLAMQIFSFFLPWALRRRILVSWFGYKLDPASRIGLSVIFADEVEMAKGAHVGHFNYVGRLDTLQMDEDSSIGNFNWITGLSTRLNSPFFKTTTHRRSELTIGRCSMLAHQHYIDCTDRISIGAYSGIAGARSQLITHGIELIRSRQSCAPISIGDYTMIGAGSLITKGVRIPDCCIVSAGSVIPHIKAEPYSLIAGNPATCIRKVPETAKFFSRTGSVIY